MVSCARYRSSAKKFHQQWQWHFPNERVPAKWGDAFYEIGKFTFRKSMKIQKTWSVKEVHADCIPFIHQWPILERLFRFTINCDSGRHTTLETVMSIFKTNEKICPRGREKCNLCDGWAPAPWRAQLRCKQSTGDMKFNSSPESGPTVVLAGKTKVCENLNVSTKTLLKPRCLDFKLAFWTQRIYA